MVAFWMMYEPQINWTNTCNNNLDYVTVKLVWNGPIDFLFDPSLHVSERMKSSTRCTLYEHKYSTIW